MLDVLDPLIMDLDMDKMDAVLLSLLSLIVLQQLLVLLAVPEVMLELNMLVMEGSELVKVMVTMEVDMGLSIRS